MMMRTSDNSSSSSSSFTSQFRAQFKRIFLPDGFPNTVSRDYLPWLKWQMLSLFFRDVLEVLSAQSLLVAVGMDVNQANAAAPVAGAAKWVLKDGTGGLATLALGALNTKKFDENPKFFWSTANSLEDVSRAMELLTPLFPSHFLLIAGTATFVRSAALTGRSSLINGTFMTHFLSKRKRRRYTDEIRSTRTMVTNRRVAGWHRAFQSRHERVRVGFCDEQFRPRDERRDGGRSHVRFHALCALVLLLHGGEKLEF